MKQENKGAIVGFLGGAAILASFHFLSTPEIVENHIAPDTVFVAQPRTEDSLKIIKLTTLLNEKDSIIDVKPRVVYARAKATPADSTTDIAANNVFSSVQEADSSR